MRILYLHQYFVPPGGAGGTRSYEFARRLVRAGHEVTLITSDAFFPTTYQLEKDISDLMIEGIRVRVVRAAYSNQLPYWRRVHAFVKFALKSAAVAYSSGRPDVVFATSTPLTIAIPAVAAKLRFRCPMVFEVRDLWPEMPIAVGALRNPALIWAARRLEAWAYRHSKRVVALSPGMRDGVIRAGYPPTRVSVIPNGCDLELFRAEHACPQQVLQRIPQLTAGGALVLYAGTLGKLNGIEYLVRIASAMRKIDPQVRFLIVGDGKERNAVHELAVQEGVLYTNLWILPPVTKEKMPDLLAASTVAVSLFIDLPEMWNNSANKFFDALAAGRPVMINYGGWQAGLLEQSGAGIAIPPDDPVSASRLLLAFLSDEERLRRAGEAAVALARTRFDRDRLAEEFRGLLEKVVEEVDGKAPV